MEEKKLLLRKPSKKVIWIIVAVVLVVLVVVFTSLKNQASKKSETAYQTQTLSKGELVAVIGGTGTVRSNQSAYLTWQTSGRVEKINYEIGDSVSTGDVLASLELTSLPQSVISAQASLIQAKQDLQDLEQSTSALANAQLTLAKAQEAYNSALNDYWNRDQTQGTSKQITLTEAKLQILDNKIYDLQKLYDNMAELKDTDTKKAQTLQNLTQDKIDRDTLKRLLDYYKATMNPTDLAVMEGNLAVAKANLEQAQSDYDRIKATGVDPNTLAADQANIAALQATVNFGSLTAPFSGVVTESNSLVGDLVNAGTTSFRIDDLSRLLVDVEIPEVDINSVKLGQTATLTFDAVSNKEYSAKVIKMDSVGTPSNGVVNFTVTLQVLDADNQVKPGMTAAVNITVTQLKNVLTVPNRAVRTVNNKRVIYLLKNGIALPVPVELGSSSDTSSVILSGDVKAGDVVILNPSTDLLSVMQQQSAR
jgi:HlyD family secretion protein